MPPPPRCLMERLSNAISSASLCRSSASYRGWVAAGQLWSGLALGRGQLSGCDFECVALALFASCRGKRGAAGHVRCIGQSTTFAWAKLHNLEIKS